MTQLDEYWNKFLAEKALSQETKCAGDLFFEAKGFVSDEMNALVLGGQKTAFFRARLQCFHLHLPVLPFPMLLH